MTAKTEFALLQSGFRPFFLLALLFAPIEMMLWIISYLEGFSITSHYGNISWHGHEMLFGYALAVLTGFLLVAGKNWTGIQTLQHRSLMFLAGLWVMARSLHFLPELSPSILTFATELLFILLAIAFIAAPLLQSRNRNSYIFIELLIILAIGNIMVDWSYLGLFPNTAETGMMLSLYAVLGLLIIINGRTLPHFIEKSFDMKLARTQYHQTIETFAVGSIYLLMILEVLLPMDALIGLTALVAAIANGIRLANWYHPALWRNPLLWVLLVGYGWIIVGLMLYAAASFGLIMESRGLHALTIGGIGVTTAGMMVRVTLGHTGRELKADSLTTTAFILLNVSALAYAIFHLLAPTLGEKWLLIAGMSWVVAFGMLAWVYTPMLLFARVDGKPG
jgi:uncharacterized protein involved in response to NO